MEIRIYSHKKDAESKKAKLRAEPVWLTSDPLEPYVTPKKLATQ
jgi:hypothetical protein